MPIDPYSAFNNLNQQVLDFLDLYNLKVVLAIYFQYF